MLSAAPPLFSSSSNSRPLLREVQVLYRRICVLRASGKNSEADLFESEKLAPAIAKVRESSAVTESQIDAVLASEEERVDTAQVLAELLLPLLTAATDAAPLRRAFPSTSSADSNARTAFESTEEPPSPANGGPMLPGIADFIDEMLTQDRAPTDPRNSRRSA
jgi:hypothetical protein